MGDKDVSLYISLMLFSTAINFFFVSDFLSFKP